MTSRGLAYPDPELTDGVVRLRKWSEDDLGCIEEASHDRAITEGTTVPPVFTPEEGRAFVHRQWSRINDGVAVSFAVADAETDRAQGLVILPVRPQNGVAGLGYWLGYWLAASARGRGRATRAVRLISDWALRDLSMQRVEAWVEPDNVASQQVLRHAGFDKEGRLRNFLELDGRRTDALVFSRIP